MPTWDYVLTSLNQPLTLLMLTQLCQRCHSWSSAVLGLPVRDREPRAEEAMGGGNDVLKDCFPSA